MRLTTAVWPRIRKIQFLSNFDWPIRLISLVLVLGELVLVWACDWLISD